MNQITQLIIKYLKEELTTGERRELDDWIALSEENKRFFDQYTEQSIAEKLALMSEIDWKAGYDKFLARYQPEGQPAAAPVQQLPVRRRWLAAAVLLLLAGGALFLWIGPTRVPPKEDKAAMTDRYKNDIAPGGLKAVLTLGNAQTIILDTASNTTLAGQGSRAINKEGELSYATAAASPLGITYNTVTTPRGGAYKVVLPDGSKVWLNAASSIRFPTVFSGNERTVEVTGEVYFEVAALSLERPSTALRTFKVLVNEMEVEVVGTHFNINAYDDEAAIYTTLLEGIIKVKTTAAGSKVRVLQPGQQAQIKDRQLSVIEKVDEETVVAWKNGYFHFEGADIQTVMRQVARWYDVTISYGAPILRKEFVATINRDEPVSKLLQLLELTNEVHFRIDGKKIHVMP